MIPGHDEDPGPAHHWRQLRAQTEASLVHSQHRELARAEAFQQRPEVSRGHKSWRLTADYCTDLRMAVCRVQVTTLAPVTMTPSCLL